MSKTETYKIDLKALNTDTTEFSYKLDDSFFSLVEATEIQRGNLKVDLRIRKTSGAFELTFNTEGTVTVQCDRCLDDLELPIESTDILKVKFGEEYIDEEVLITIPEHDGTIDVAWHIYEFVALQLPIKHTHAPGKCNATVMQEINKHLATRSGDEENEGEEGMEGSSDAPTDPRWDALKKLKE